MTYELKSPILGFEHLSNVQLVKIDSTLAKIQSKSEQFEIYLVPVCTKILYGKLACYDPQTVLKQLESAAAELNFLDHYWLLPRAENVPNRKERTVYSKQFGCFSEPGQFDLSRRATRTECTLVTSPIPEGPEQSKRVYQQALGWVDPFYEFYK